MEELQTIIRCFDYRVVEFNLGENNKLLLEKLVKLAHFTLCRVELPLFLFAGFFVVLMFFDIGHQTGFFTLFCETSECLLKRLTFTKSDCRHKRLDPSFLLLLLLCLNIGNFNPQCKDYLECG